MNKEIITKIVTLLLFCFFAGISALMTATAFSYGLTNQLGLFLTFIIAFVVSCASAEFLRRAIKEAQNRIDPSIVKFGGYMIGFLVFWLVISFSTNVHFSIIQKHGVENLNAQLTDLESYYDEKMNYYSKGLTSEESTAISELRRGCNSLFNDFWSELTKVERPGFSDISKGNLKKIENFLNETNELYNEEKNKYGNSIYNEQNQYDTQYSDVTASNKFDEIRKHFENKMNIQIDAKIISIQNYYLAKKKDTMKLQTSLDSVRLYKKRLANISSNEDNLSMIDKWTYRYDAFNRINKPLEQLPGFGDYKKDRESRRYKENADSTKTFVGYNPYPSERMFSVANLWEDKLTGKLPSNISFLQSILLAIFIDLLAFLLYLKR